MKRFNYNPVENLIKNENKKRNEIKRRIKNNKLNTKSLYARKPLKFSNFFHKFMMK
jgi:hypothetical protein